MDYVVLNAVPAEISEDVADITAVTVNPKDIAETAEAVNVPIMNQPRADYILGSPERYIPEMQPMIMQYMPEPPEILKKAVSDVWEMCSNLDQHFITLGLAFLTTVIIMIIINIIFGDATLKEEELVDSLSVEDQPFNSMPHSIRSAGARLGTSRAEELQRQQLKRSTNTTLAFISQRDRPSRKGSLPSLVKKAHSSSA